MLIPRYDKNGTPVLILNMVKSRRTNKRVKTFFLELLVRIAYSEDFLTFDNDVILLKRQGLIYDE